MVQKLAVLALASVLLVACGGASDAPQASPADGVTVLTGATLIDGNGGAPIEDAVLVLRGDRIESVGTAGSVTIPEDAEVVDVAGRTIMPALIAVHAHLALTNGDGLENNAANFNEENIQQKLDQFARYGVLHVVSEGTDKPLVFDIIDRQRAGEFSGARLYTAGRGFGVQDGYPPVQPGSEGETDVFRPTNAEEAREAIAQLADREPHWVKLWVDHHFQTLPEFDPEIYTTIVEEANAAGLRAVAHIHTYEDADALIDVGIDGLIHSVRDRQVDEPLMAKMRSNDVFLIPTLAREESMFIYAGRAPYLDDPFFTEQQPASVLETLESEEFQRTHRENPELHEWEPALRTAQQNLQTLFNNGVKIGFGSDSGPTGRFEGYFEHRELELMEEAGISPADIIQIASRNSAEIIGIDEEYGTIEPGKMAEFLVLGQNPLEGISNTKTLEQVWQNGEPIHQN